MTTGSPMVTVAAQAKRALVMNPQPLSPSSRPAGLDRPGWKAVHLKLCDWLATRRQKVSETPRRWSAQRW